MRVTPRLIAQAFVDSAETLPPEEHDELISAVLSLLASNNLLKNLRTFPALVERVWRKQRGTVSFRLTTTTGKDGGSAEEICRIVEQSLKRPCECTERAYPSIIGGLLLEIDDERFDATVRRSLLDLSARLTEPLTVTS